MSVLFFFDKHSISAVRLDVLDVADAKVVRDNPRTGRHLLKLGHEPLGHPRQQVHQDNIGFAQVDREDILLADLDEVFNAVQLNVGFRFGDSRYCD